MPSLAQMPTAPQPAPAELDLPPDFPVIPDELIQRFPSLQDWVNQVNIWYSSISNVLTQSTGTIASVVNNSSAQIAALQEQLAALQEQLAAQENGAFVGGAVAAVGVVPIPDKSGNMHNALVAT